MAPSKRSPSSKRSVKKVSASGRPPSTAKRAAATSKATRSSPARSSKSPALPQPTAVLAAIGTAMKVLKVRWYLFGAQAVAVWGKPRMTADVDVTADVPLQRIGELLVALRSAGFSSRERDVEALARETRVIPLQFGRPPMPVDVVLSGPGLEEDFHLRSQLVKLGRIRIPVISPEDLVTTKVIAGRPRDLEDVRGILQERGDSLDLDLVRRTLTEVEAALDRSDLVSVLQTLRH